MFKVKVTGPERRARKLVMTVSGVPLPDVRVCDYPGSDLSAFMQSDKTLSDVSIGFVMPV